MFAALLSISLKLFKRAQGSINSGNIWHQIGDKPLPETKTANWKMFQSDSEHLKNIPIAGKQH